MLPATSLFRHTSTLTRTGWTGNGMVETPVAENIPTSVFETTRTDAGTDGPITYNTVTLLVRPPADVRPLSKDVVEVSTGDTVTVRSVKQVRTQTGRISHYELVCW